MPDNDEFILPSSDAAPSRRGAAVERDAAILQPMRRAPMPRAFRHANDVHREPRAPPIKLFARCAMLMRCRATRTPD